MTRAFVVGASGYTGHAVVRALRARGVETYAHVRPDSRQLAELRASFEALGASVDTTSWDGDALERRLAEVRPEVVFALLGTTRARAARDKRDGHDSSYEAVDYGLSIRALTAAARCGTSPRFVYLSSLGVTKTTTNAYLEVRWRVEQAVIASGLPYLIARPSFITGPDRPESRPAERVGAVVVDAVLGGFALFGARRLRDRFGSKTADQLGVALVTRALAPDFASGVVESEALS